MINVKEKALDRLNVNSIAQFMVLGSIALFLPFLLHIQWITGPVMNAIFILTLFLFGIRTAVVVALVPSLMALSGGLLPAVLAPVIPFIMLSNIIFIFSIDFLYNSLRNPELGYWLGVVTGGALKFLFLYFSVTWIQGLLLQGSFAPQVAQMMSWPQFFTAFLGGVMAWGVLKALRRI